MSHHTSIGARVAATPQNAGERVALDDLAAAKHHSIVASHPRYWLSKAAKLGDNPARDPFFHLDYPSWVTFFQAEARPVERGLWIQMVFKQVQKDL